MNRDSIWEALSNQFPDLAKIVESYKKVGSKTIKLKMKAEDGSDKYLYYLYNDPWDWTLGSKVWRAKPRKNFRNNIDEVIDEIKEDQNGNSDNNNE